MSALPFINPFLSTTADAELDVLDLEGSLKLSLSVVPVPDAEEIFQPFVSAAFVADAAA